MTMLARESREGLHIPCHEECLLRPGNTNCGGCDMSNALTMLGRIFDKSDTQAALVIPACCGIVTAGGYPTSSYGTPVLASTFGSASAFAAGVASICDLNDDNIRVVNWCGDGGTYDIGMATLSASAELNDHILYICYDNEIYGNTGGQRSSATPVGAKTSTTPFGKQDRKKDIMSIMAAHRIPYAASLSIAHPEDFERKMQAALARDGFRFLLIHSPCPTGWKSEPAQTIQLVRLAVSSGLFPLFEVFDGVRYRVNSKLDGTDPEEYYQLQGRFKPEEIDLDAVRAEARATRDRLQTLAQTWPARDDE
jgi:pyruvate ferredoxin oxidoreductase beta subunit/2-oxoisovalerate ferredoxin oxidoreductase beta subunit